MNVKFKMMCSECGLIVSYELGESFQHYGAVKLALSKAHRFAFKDWCAMCEKDRSFGINYEQEPSK